MKKMKGRSWFREKWSSFLSVYIADDKIKYSLESILVAWFDHELRDETDLFNDEIPEESDSEDIEPFAIEDYKKNCDLYIAALRKPDELKFFAAASQRGRLSHFNSVEANAKQFVYS